MQAVKFLLRGTTEIPSHSMYFKQYEKRGGYSQTLRDFESLKPIHVENFDLPGLVGMFNIVYDRIKKSYMYPLQLRQRGTSPISLSVLFSRKGFGFDFHRRDMSDKSVSYPTDKKMQTRCLLSWHTCNQSGGR